MAVSIGESYYRVSLKRETPAFIHGDLCWPESSTRSPCVTACPLQMDIPNYVIAISEGNMKKALSIIRESNPLPSICGRVCHHPCEQACNRGVVDQPIAIEWLKRFKIYKWNSLNHRLLLHPLIHRDFLYIGMIMEVYK